MSWLWLVLSVSQFWNTNLQSLINCEVTQLWHWLGFLGSLIRLHVIYLALPLTILSSEVRWDEGDTTWLLSCPFEWWLSMSWLYNKDPTPSKKIQGTSSLLRNNGKSLNARTNHIVSEWASRAERTEHFLPSTNSRAFYHFLLGRGRVEHPKAGMGVTPLGFSYPFQSWSPVSL